MTRVLILFCILIIPILVLVEILQIRILMKDGNIWVYEYEGERCLAFSLPIISPRQTCMNLKDNRKIIFEYQKFALSSLFVNPDPKKVLIVGLGGGLLANTLHYLLPNSQIDVVEIDEKVIEIASRYFNLTINDQLKVFHDDGVHFIRNSTASYDLIILDAFDEEYIPQSFLTDSFVVSVKRILNHDGVIVVNTFSKSKYASLENSLYEKQFGDFYSLESHNRVIVAGKILQTDEIKKNSHKFDKIFSQLGIENNALLEKFIKSYKKVIPCDKNICYYNK
jgi:spermidine synthase